MQDKIEHPLFEINDICSKIKEAIDIPECWDLYTRDDLIQMVKSLYEYVSKEPNEYKISGWHTPVWSKNLISDFTEYANSLEEAEELWKDVQSGLADGRFDAGEFQEIYTTRFIER